MLIFPQTAPYLCYKNDFDNRYYLEYIHSSIMANNYSNSNRKTFEKKNKYFNPFFYMSSFKITPSLLFPTINSFNIDNYKLLFDFYNQSYVNIYTPELDRPYSSKLNFLHILK